MTVTVLSVLCCMCEGSCMMKGSNCSLRMWDLTICWHSTWVSSMSLLKHASSCSRLPSKFLQLIDQVLSCSCYSCCFCCLHCPCCTCPITSHQYSSRWQNLSHSSPGMFCMCCTPWSGLLEVKDSVHSWMLPLTPRKVGAELGRSLCQTHPGDTHRGKGGLKFDTLKHTKWEGGGERGIKVDHL